MLFARLSLVAFASTLISAVAGDLKVISPGGSTLWWIANSDNTLLWDCSDKTHDQFNVLIANSNPSALVAPLPIIPTLQNFVCSKLIPAAQLPNLPAATGYTIQLTNIFNNTDIYATSEPFELKSVGSAYPDSSATPGSGSSSRTPSSTSSGSSPSSSTNNSSSSNNGGSKNVLSALGAFAAIVVGVITA